LQLLELLTQVAVAVAVLGKPTMVALAVQVSSLFLIK
jgi:hypothetical protein